MDYIQAYLFEDKQVMIDPAALQAGGSWGYNKQNVRRETTDTGLQKLVYNLLARLHHPVFWDIGASTGSYCLQTKFHKGSTCHAFEPNSRIVPILRNNIAANGLEDRVIVHPFALGHTAGRGILKIPTQSGLATLGTPLRFKKWREEEVQIRRIDDLGLGPVDFIKIDVEGSELSILKGAEQTIKKYWPAILAETYEVNAQQCGTTATNTAGLLGEWGYTGTGLELGMDTYFWKQEIHKR